MRIVLRMPGKSRGGRKGDANLSPRLSSHAQIRPHTCENVEVQRRGQYVGGEASVSATRESALFTFQEAFATLYTPRRAIICIPGANTPPMLRRKGRTLSFRNAIFHHRLPLLLFLLVLSLSLEKRQGRKGTMVMAKQRSTSRCSIENATNAAIKTKWWLVTRRLFSPLHSSPPSLVFKLVLRSCNI